MVAVDGSESAQRALAWAVDEARLRSAELVIVTCWSVPVELELSLAGTLGGLDGSFETYAQSVLDKAVADVKAAPDAPTVSGALWNGAASVVLVDEARGADLLVVGSRGHGGLSGVMLGSVSAYLAHHAPCPLVIIRG
jgi:nucleotide-binding universal stress UspA family protein